MGVAQHGAVRGQTTATRARGPATQYFTFGDDEDVPAPGERLFWPQERDLRRSPAHDEELTLHVPALQMVEQPEEVDSFFRNFVPAVAEQVIEVPKLALPVCAVQRAALPEPQLVEQLVEVPTVLSYSLLQQRTAEQIIDFPFPGRGGGARGGLQGLPQGQVSTASAGEQTIVPSRGGLHGFSPGQGSTAFPSPERISERLWSKTSILGGDLHGVQGFLTRQSSAALSEQVPFSAVHAATAPVVGFMASAPAVHAAPAPVGEFMASAPSVHAAPAPLVVYTSPGSTGDDASRVEQDLDVEGVDYLGRVVFHSGTCVMLDMVDFNWRSLGEGTFRLLLHSEGAKFFQFWRRRQLLVEDVISGLVLRSGSKGLSWRWRNPEFEDGPSDYRHAVRFQSPVLARRFYDEWNSS